MYKELNYIRRYGSTGTGGGQPTGGRGRNRRRTNFDEATEELIRITDEARERERRESNLDRIQRENREEESFQREQERRMNRTGREGYNLVNLNNLEGSQINAVLRQNINANKEKDNIYDRRDQEKNNLLNKVIAAKKLSEKTEILVDRINTISKKPMEIITGALDKADQRLFELIYGKEGMGEEKDIKGFLDAMLFQLNN